MTPLPTQKGNAVKRWLQKQVNDMQAAIDHVDLMPQPARDGFLLAMRVTWISGAVGGVLIGAGGALL